MPSPKRDRMTPASGKLMRADDSVYDLAEALASVIAGGKVAVDAAVNLGDVTISTAALEALVGALTDATVAAGATGSVSAKLRRVTTDLAALLVEVGAVDATAVTDAAASGSTVALLKGVLKQLQGTGPNVSKVLPYSTYLQAKSIQFTNGCTGSNGNLTFDFTSAIANCTKTLTIAVTTVAQGTAELVAVAVRSAITSDSDLNANYTVSGVGTGAVIVTAKVSAPTDLSLNMALTGAASTGVTAEKASNYADSGQRVRVGAQGATIFKAAAQTLNATPAEIALPAGINRPVVVWIQNTGSVAIYLMSPAGTIAAGFPIQPGDMFPIQVDPYNPPRVFGATASGDCTIRVCVGAI
jgi:hypothetical protein